MILLMNFTAGDFWLNGEKVFHTERKAFTFIAKGEKYSGEVKTLGKKMKKQNGFEVDFTTPLKTIFAGEDVKNIIGYDTEIPNITYGEALNIVSKMRGTTVKNYTKEQWIIYDLVSAIDVDYNLKKKTFKPVYKETPFYTEFDCPMNGEQPLIVRDGMCGFPKAHIVIKWEVEEKKETPDLVKRAERKMRKL